MALAFDTYEFIHELKNSGFSEAQAKVISDGIKKSAHECNFCFKEKLQDFSKKVDLKDFVRKDDIKDFVTKNDLKQELRVLEIKLRGEIKQTANVVTLRVTGLMALILALFELFQHFKVH